MRKVLLLTIIILGMISCDKEELVPIKETTTRDSLINELVDLNTIYTGRSKYKYTIRLTEQWSDTSGLLVVKRYGPITVKEYRGYFDEDLRFIELYKNQDTILQINKFTVDTLYLTYYPDINLTKLWK